MNITIRKFERTDADAIIGMMRKFYGSPAVITNGSEEIFAANVANCLNGSTCAEGFVFVDDAKIIGYAITTRSYSTEFGSECIWLEDIFIAQEYRGRGIGSEFIRRVKGLHPEKILRLESEAGNAKALSFYERFGFKPLPYLELVLPR